MLSQEEPWAAARSLAETAFRRGSMDNICVMAVDLRCVSIRLSLIIIIIIIIVVVVINLFDMMGGRGLLLTFLLLLLLPFPLFCL